MNLLHIPLLRAALAAAALGLLGACTGAPRAPDGGATTSGVTVYGTVDAGVSRTDKRSRQLLF